VAIRVDASRSTIAHDRCADGGEWKIGVGPNKVTNPDPIARPKFDHFEGLAGTERLEKNRLRSRDRYRAR
jgi:hypothetical protein